MSISLSGIGVSRGIAVGHAHWLERGVTEVLEASIPEAFIEDEVARFRRAVRLARQQLKDIRHAIPETTRADITDFIDTHLLMLEDSMLTLAPVELIREQRCNAEWALKCQRDELAAVFDEMDDPYLRTRKDDVDHVINRIMRILLRQENIPELAGNEARSLRGAIVLAHDLTPADTALLQHQGVAGFVTESGGPLSHTAILARSLGIPAMVGVHLGAAIHEGDTIILDGEAGVLIAEPDEDLLKEYRRRQRQAQKRRTELNRLKDLPSVTLDGIPIHLNANIELREDVRAARRVGAEGIGLYRTEFLFMNRDDIPDEEEQLRQYSSVIRSLKGMPLTIRTLDLGADKDAAPCAEMQDHVATNPALGLRAIRLCLKHVDLFRPQLRAILRASARGPVRMMIPMLSSGSELTQVLDLIDEVRQELAMDGLAFDPDMPVGGMIEVPAAALVASLFARHLDFLSIGTNDLVQYTLAIDRVDDEVTYLYDPLHPAVLRLVKMVIDAGRSAQVPVSMCGEMAGDARYTRLLLGMGLTDFSVPPNALLEIKAAVRQACVSDIDALVRQLLASDEPERIAQLLNTINEL
ncbi:MAG TPA: phosphoenolpyruvate--protein phosphotransferase [Gammaproteobacteria bacterium]|nr:phosphoenolpyruvate--protein phosphotransferase [Gammaproteobacteria bacterium]